MGTVQIALSSWCALLNPKCSLHGFSLECFSLHSLPPSLSPSLHAVGVLLAVLRVLLNLTHDNELGSHRLGEQEGAVKTVLDIIFLVLLTQCFEDDPLLVSDSTHQRCLLH